MDHKEQHHEHHRKEREHEKKAHAEHERAGEKTRAPIHPAWIWTSGFVLVGAALAIWTFMAR